MGEEASFPAESRRAETVSAVSMPAADLGVGTASRAAAALRCRALRCGALRCGDGCAAAPRPAGDLRHRLPPWLAAPGGVCTEFARPHN